MYHIMSSLNYNSMLATHTICSEEHYKLRLYGTDRFTKLKCDDYFDLIKVFKELPENLEELLMEKESEEYIVVIELDDNELDYTPLHDGYYCLNIIYLDSIKHKISFLNEKQQKIVQAKSKVVVEVKEPIQPLEFYSKGNLTKYESISADSYRNSIKGTHLMMKYLKQKFNINAIDNDDLIFVQGLSLSQLEILNEYFTKIIYLKSRCKNHVRKDNLTILQKAIYKDSCDENIELMRRRFMDRDYTITHNSFEDVVYKGIFLFILKYNNFEELYFMHTDLISKAIAMIFYGTYQGFASIDRGIYKLAVE